MAQANILIVDDTPQNSAFLSRVLEKFYQVRSFNSGKSALKAAQSGWADIILLDTKMPMKFVVSSEQESKLTI